jgi:hypothetical protein
MVSAQLLLPMWQRGSHSPVRRKASSQLPPLQRSARVRAIDAAPHYRPLLFLILGGPEKKLEKEKEKALPSPTFSNFLAFPAQAYRSKRCSVGVLSFVREKKRKKGVHSQQKAYRLLEVQRGYWSLFLHSPPSMALSDNKPLITFIG